MKQCPNCSTKNENSAKFCNHCGTSLESAAETLEERTSDARGVLNKAGHFLSDGIKKAKEAVEAGTGGAQDPQRPGNFVSQSESHLSGQPGGGWDQAVYSPAASHGDWSSAIHPNAAVSVTEEHYPFFRDEDEKTLAVIGGSDIASDLEGHYRSPYAVLTEKHLYIKNDLGNYVVDTSEIRAIKDNLVKIPVWPIWVALVLAFILIFEVMA